MSDVDLQKDNQQANTQGPKELYDNARRHMRHGRTGEALVRYADIISMHRDTEWGKKALEEYLRFAGLEALLQRPSPSLSLGLPSSYSPQREQPSEPILGCGEDYALLECPDMENHYRFRRLNANAPTVRESQVTLDIAVGDERTEIALSLNLIARFELNPEMYPLFGRALEAHRAGQEYSARLTVNEE